METWKDIPGYEGLYSRFVNPMDISCDGFLAKNSGILREFYEAITRRKENV